MILSEAATLRLLQLLPALARVLHLQLHRQVTAFAAVARYPPIKRTLLLWTAIGTEALAGNRKPLKRWTLTAIASTAKAMAASMTTVQMAAEAASESERAAVWCGTVLP